MAKVPHGGEKLLKSENFNWLSSAHERYRQTDRQTTDGRATAYSERKFTFTNKNSSGDEIANVNIAHVEASAYAH